MYLLLLLLPPLYIASYTYIIYHYEACNADSAPPPPYGPWALTLGIAQSYCAMLMALLATLAHPFMRGRGVLPDTAAKRRPPLILVHGTYHNTGAWLLYRFWLAKAGYTRVYCPSYRVPLGNISQGDGPAFLAGVIEKAVSEAERLWPEEKPLLVGHSAGGLLLRLWLCGQGTGQRLRGAVTLGAPHQGTRMARIAFWTPGHLHSAFAFRSPFLTALEQAERPSEIPCTAIYSRTDNIIVPEQGMLPPKELGWKTRTTNVSASHLWLLWRKPVCHQVIEELESITSSTDPRS